MPSETPSPPPEAVIIRLAREAANVTIPQAARAAGISTARWSQVEAGRETRGGAVRPVRGKARTIAHMAQAVGVPPARLREQGQRPDAAEILAEIQRSPAPGEIPGRPQLTPVPDALAAGIPEAEDEELLASVAATHPALAALNLLQDGEGNRLPYAQRRELMLTMLRLLATGGSQEERERRQLLPCGGGRTVCLPAAGRLRSCNVHFYR